MVDIFAPEVDPSGDIQTLEMLLQQTGISLGIILPGTLTAADDDIAAAVLLQQMVVVGHIADKVTGRVVINLHIGVVLEEILGVEQAAEGQAAAEQIGTAQVEVDTVIAAHAGASEHHLTVIAVEGVGLGMDLVQTGQQLITDVLDVLLMPHDTAMMVAVLGAPGLLIHTTDAEQLHLAILQLISDGVYHAAALKVKELAILAGENDEGQTGVAVDLEFHVALEIVGVFLVVTGMHS